MKNLRLIVLFFFSIFISGIFLTYLTINKTLNNKESKEESFHIKKDTTYLLPSTSKI